jgi:hypothetical protein
VPDNYLIAGNPDTPCEQLRLLLSDGDAGVRRRLAENPCLPLDLLLELARDPDAEVRCAVAEHPQTPRALLEQLARDENVEVRYAIAGQYSLPADLLEMLAESDENPYVRDHARRTLEGIFLELALKDTGFEPHPGDEEKLGALLTETGILEQAQLQDLLRLCKEQGRPLGRVLVESRCLPRSLILAALRMQAAVRRGQLEHQEALLQIRDALQKP